MKSTEVSLQINLAPGDIQYVTDILPHQLRTFAAQVSEIQFTVDTQQSRAFRSATDDYVEKLRQLRNTLANVCEMLPKAKIVEVDYSESSMLEVARFFTGAASVPRKACDGSAFYAYLFGMLRAKHDFILHLDSDMLFGGGSQSWVSEGVQLLIDNPDIFACYPFPGPPNADGTPSRRRLTSLWADVSITQSCVKSELQRLAYSYNEVSTRALLFDRRLFRNKTFQLPLVRPRFRRALRSMWIKTSPCLLLEDCMTVLINQKGLRCIAFAGSGDGVWSLHPRWRSKQFYAELPSIIRKVETDDVPDGQRGDFDMNTSMVDLSDVFRGLTRWKRFKKEMRLVYFGLADRVTGG